MGRRPTTPRKPAVAASSPRRNGTVVDRPDSFRRRRGGRPPKVLYIVGSINQCEQLHAVHEHLADWDAFQAKWRGSYPLGPGSAIWPKTSASGR